ncbi:S8 family serine peptidase [Paraconexibacter antarcticus]|uniref:S8 family serine peptidase n=1 Tax=Paraconexibacter antarcticus TaxID=2949664 RepID=A0ABY5DRH6_9ACTN|nr:S8 family serine peptidase [Paraconexibacter antarcticus]UTI64189.1 S8 family serine peptidase [Paraconexibacter antarcticus]
MHPRPRTLAAALLASLIFAVPAAEAAVPRVGTDGLASRPAAAPTHALRAVSGPDPRDGEAWHLAGDGPMGVRTAWDHTTGGDVTVAIIDTGIDQTHPDLAPNLWTNPGEIPGNGIDDDHDGYVDDVHGVDLVNHDGNPQDDNGHGTHVAGIIGAAGGNGIGAAGIAWHVKLMAVKALDANAAGNTGTVADGIEYAIHHGARIINLSLAGAGRSAGLEAAIVDAQQAGVLVVVAAGNDHQDLGLTPSYPASYPEPNVLGVAATREDSLLSSISDFGAGVDIAAPGEDIFSTALGGGYEYRTGTSMAAPMVAGSAALLLAANPQADANALAGTLLANTRRTGLPVATGALDIGAALGGPVAASGSPAAVPAPAPVARPAAAKAKKKTKASAKARSRRTARSASSRARQRRAAATRAKAARARAARVRAAHARAARVRAARARARAARA